MTFWKDPFHRYDPWHEDHVDREETAAAAADTPTPTPSLDGSRCRVDAAPMIHERTSEQPCWAMTSSRDISRPTEMAAATDDSDSAPKRRATPDADEDDDAFGKRRRRWRHCGTGQNDDTLHWVEDPTSIESSSDDMQLDQNDDDDDEDGPLRRRRIQDRIRQLELAASNHGRRWSIDQHIIDQFAQGSGGLLRDDRYLLEEYRRDELLRQTAAAAEEDGGCFCLEEPAEWLELVVHARNRAKAWDASQYTRERNVLQNWLR